MLQNKRGLIVIKSEAIKNKFLPGENIVIPQHFPAVATKSYLRVKFPSRVSMDVIDRNRISRSTPGGGGYGFGIDVDNFISVSISNIDSVEIEEKQLPVAKHFIHIMKKTLGFDGFLEVKVEMDKSVKQHVGLGSSIMLSSSIVWAINSLFGHPLTKDTCIDLVLDNYCEAHEGKHLIKGLSLGVGAHVAFNGGFVICTDKAQRVFWSEMPIEYKVILVDNGSVRTKEIDSNLKEHHKELDNFFSRHKAYIILMDIIPAIRQGNWAVLGKYIYEFLFAGPAQCFLQAYEDRGIKIISDVEAFLMNEAIVAGISSLGPLTYAITKDADSIKRFCEERNYKMYEFHFNNTGMIEVESRAIEN